jgi:hypothetical protein
MPVMYKDGVMSSRRRQVRARPIKDEETNFELGCS